MTKAVMLGLALLISTALVQAQDQGQQTPPQSTAPSAGQTSPDTTQPATPAPDQTTPDNTQTAPSNPGGAMQNPTPSPDTTGPMKNSTTTSNAQATPTSATGCVRIEVDHFVLKDTSGKTYNLAGDTSNLHEDVGQQITVTGVVDNTSAGSTNVTTPQESTESQRPTITVQNVQKAGGNCMNGGK